MSLLTANGKPAEKEEAGPWTVGYAFILGTRDDGSVQVVDHEYAYEVRSKRQATLDDMYGAAGLAWTRDAGPVQPQEAPYVTAFLIFQLPEGPIIANPDVFHNIVPVTSPGSLHIKAACDVIRGQILAQKAAEMAGPLAAQAALSGMSVAIQADKNAKANAEVQSLISKTRR